MKWSPDGTHFVSASWNDLQVWSSTDYKPVRRIYMPYAYFRNPKYSRDGTHFATLGYDHTIRIWDAQSGRKLESFQLPNGQRGWGLDWSPDGKRIAAATNAGVAVWRLGIEDAGTMIGPIFQPPEKSDTPAVAWSPDGRYLAIGRYGELTVLDADSGETKLDCRPHIHDLWTLDWSSDSSKVATGAFDQHAKIIDIDTGKELRDFVHRSGVSDVAFSPDNHVLACATEGQDIVLWDVQSGKTIGQLAGHSSWVESIDWDHDGRRLISGSADRSVRVWNFDRSDRAPQYPSSRTSINLRYGLAACPQGDGTLRISNVSNPSSSYVVDGTYGFWSTDGCRLATQQHGAIRIVDSANGNQQLAFSTKGGELVAGWSGDNRLLLTRKDNIISVWDAYSGTSPASIGVDNDDEVEWQPTGTLFATISDKHIAVWDAALGRRLFSVATLHAEHRDNLRRLVWSPDGTQFATNRDDGRVDVREALTGRILHKLVGHSVGQFVIGLAWSPDSTRLATAGWDHTLKIWDLRTGKESLSVDAQASKIYSISFSPDGKRLSTADWMGTVCLWDAESGAEILVLDETRRELGRRLFWSNDGETLYSCGDQGLTVFDAKLGYEMASNGALDELVSDQMYQEGIEHAHSSLTEDSNQLFHRADELSGPNRWAYLQRATIYMSVGADAEAVADLESYLSVCPDDAESQNELAWLLANRRDGHVRDPQRALHIAEQLVRVWPQEGHFWATMGLARYRLGSWDEAIESLSKAAELSRNHRGRVHLLIAMARRNLGRQDKVERNSTKLSRSMQMSNAICSKVKI